MATDESRNTSPTEPERQRARLPRRGFLRGVGASALATAAVVFGLGRPAEAVQVGCCHLGSSAGAWSTCASRSDRYIWRCRMWTPYGACYRAYECCDAGRTPWGTWTISAARQITCY
jgi:hypothetical protein